MRFLSEHFHKSSCFLFPPIGPCLGFPVSIFSGRTMCALKASLTPFWNEVGDREAQVLTISGVPASPA